LQITAKIIDEKSLCLYEIPRRSLGRFVGMTSYNNYNLNI